MIYSRYYRHVIKDLTCEEINLIDIWESWHTMSRQEIVTNIYKRRVDNYEHKKLEDDIMRGTNRWEN